MRTEYLGVMEAGRTLFPGLPWSADKTASQCPGVSQSTLYIFTLLTLRTTGVYRGYIFWRDGRTTFLFGSQLFKIIFLCKILYLAFEALVYLIKYLLLFPKILPYINL